MKKKKILKEDEIKHLGKLANLTLTNEEIKIYRRQMEETLDYIKNLNELNTKKTPPTSHTVNLTDIFFADGEKNTRGLDIGNTLKNAKNKKNGFFVVKRIL